MVWCDCSAAAALIVISVVSGTVIAHPFPFCGRLPRFPPHPAMFGRSPGKGRECRRLWPDPFDNVRPATEDEAVFWFFEVSMDPLGDQSEAEVEWRLSGGTCKFEKKNVKRLNLDLHYVISREKLPWIGATTGSCWPQRKQSHPRQWAKHYPTDLIIPGIGRKWQRLWPDPFANVRPSAEDEAVFWFFEVSMDLLGLQSEAEVEWRLSAN